MIIFIREFYCGGIYVVKISDFREIEVGEF